MDKRVLGQIYICGAFSNAPNKQSRHARIHLHLVSASLPGPNNVGHVYTLFLLSFNIVLEGGGGGGRKATQFKTDSSAFIKLRFENTEN